MEEALAIAAAHLAESGAPNISFVKADCRTLPYQSQFDLVYSAGLIEHFFDHDRDVVREHVRVLMTGGTAIMSVPYRYTLHALHYFLSRPLFLRWLWPWSGERHFQKFYSRRELRALGAQTGAPYRVFFLPPWPVGWLLGLLVLELRLPAGRQGRQAESRIRWQAH